MDGHGGAPGAGAKNGKIHRGIMVLLKACFKIDFSFLEKTVAGVELVIIIVGYGR